MISITVTIRSVAPANEVPPVTPNWNLGKVYLWPQEGVDSGQARLSRFARLAWESAKLGQGDIAEMGASVHLQQPGPWKDIPNQASH